MKAKNLKEARALVDRYETITLEEIKGNFNPGALTGFGNSRTCTLCDISGFDPCEYCIYKSHCKKGIHQKTYYRIFNANTPLKLLNAFRARAEHIRKIINY